MTDDELDEWASKIYSAQEFMEWPLQSGQYPDNPGLLAMKEFVVDYEAKRG